MQRSAFRVVPALRLARPAMRAARPMSTSVVTKVKPMHHAARYAEIDGSWAAGKFALAPLTLGRTYLTGMCPPASRSSTLPPSRSNVSLALLSKCSPPAQLWKSGLEVIWLPLSCMPTTELLALARWGGVAIFGVYWLLGPSYLRDDIFFMLPASMPADDDE